jgi:hypothetical protein
MPIGDWDNSDSVFGFMAKAEANFRTSDANTGFANMYNGPAASGTITGTLTNMATGYGYVYNGGDAYYRFDASNDEIATNGVFSVSNTGEITVEAWVNYVSGQGGVLFGAADAPINRSAFYVFPDGRLFGWIEVADVVKQVRSVETLSEGEHLIHFCISSTGLLKTYIDGSETTYSTQETYNSGDYTYTDGISFGVESLVASPLGIDTSSVIVYDSDISDSRKADNFLLGSDYGGLIASDNGDGTMALSAPSSGVVGWRSNMLRFY